MAYAMPEEVRFIRASETSGYATFYASLWREEPVESEQVGPQGTGTLYRLN